MGSYNEPRQVRHVLYYAYANITAADWAMNDASREYTLADIEDIKRKTYHRHYKHKMKPGAMTNEMDVVRELLKNDWCFYCCQSEKKLTKDHFLITTSKWNKIKSEFADSDLARAKSFYEKQDHVNMVCGGCNSSRSNRDFVEWWQHKWGQPIPPLYVLRPYLKLQIEWCDAMGIMEHPEDEVDKLGLKLPFSIHTLPREFPSLEELDSHDWLKFRDRRPGKKESTG